MNIYGVWHGQFFSRSGGIHQFTMKLESEVDGTLASLRLNRATPDPRSGKTEIHFKDAQAKVTEDQGCQFIALIAEDEEGQLFSTILKADANKGILSGPLVFNSVHTKGVDQEEVEWRRSSEQHPTDDWQKWHSKYESPSGNINWFTLRLNPGNSIAHFESVTKRVDGLTTDTNASVHVETSGPFIALLVKDRNPPHGMLSMILHPEDADSMRGQMIWNSLTDGAAGVVRIRESREIIWNAKPSECHPAANPH